MTRLTRLDEAALRRGFVGAIFAALASGLVLPACSAGGGQSKPIACATSQDCSKGAFCDGAGQCVDQCPDCGSTCAESSDCPTGQFCDSNQTCQRQCIAGGSGASQCGAEQVCSADGQCQARDNIVFIEDGEGEMGAEEDDTCQEQDVVFERVPANVALVIDRSVSMNDPDSFRDEVLAAEANGTYTRWDCEDTSGKRDENPGEPDFAWRWNVARNILLNPDTGVVKPLEDDVRFGMTLYSSDRGNQTGKTCPILSEVELAFGNHQAMLDAFQCSDIQWDTPTRETLEIVRTQFAALEVDGPKVIILATDGGPDSCECPNWDAGGTGACDPHNSNNDVDYAGDEAFSAGTYNVEEYEFVRVGEQAKLAQDDGIAVEVINLGGSSLKSSLDPIAKRGGAVSGAAIDGTSPAALFDAVETIIAGVRSCVIELHGEVEAGKETSGRVALDGVPLVLNDPDGWRLNSPSELELLGQACETIKKGEHDLSIKFECGTFIPIPR